MPLRLNLAALTESELLALFGSAGLQARLPELSRARLQGQPLLNGVVTTTLALPELTPEGASGGTPQQSLALRQLHTLLLQESAQETGTFTTAQEFVPATPTLLEPFSQRAGQSFLRAYVLGETAISVHWLEAPGTPDDAAPTVLMLTWLRDRASGVACVLSSNAAQSPAPAYSEEADVHVHPRASLAELLQLHRQHVARHGKTQKLATEEGWRKIWQALHDLNVRAWQRRGVLLEAES